MSKDKLFEIINSSVSDLNKLKIGILVRATLPDILEKELISESEVGKLAKTAYSKMVFDMNFPVLKEKDKNLSSLENRKIGEYTRYYATSVHCYNTEYFISSEWYDRNQEDFIRWLKRKVKQE